MIAPQHICQIGGAPMPKGIIIADDSYTYLFQFILVWQVSLDVIVHFWTLKS